MATKMAECDHCGIQHIYGYTCPWDLHGEPDPFKTCCAICEKAIPSNAPRTGDEYGNIYCCEECRDMGVSILKERNADNGEDAGGGSE